MPCPGMVFVKVAMQTLQGAMVPTMFGFAVKPVLMGALVGFVHFPVEPVMLRMIACVAVVVIVGLVSGGRHGRCGQRQRSGRDYGLRHGHDRSPWLGLPLQLTAKDMVSDLNGCRRPCSFSI